MYVYDGATASYPIDGSRTDLAAEFKANIRGPHSDELRRVLHRLRSGPLAGKYVVVIRKPFEEWVLGQLTGVRGEPVRLHGDRVFHTLDDAEWAVFKLRWRDLTGVELDL